MLPGTSGRAGAHVEALEEFDRRMDTAVACIARTTVDPHLPVIRSLPSDLGGLGLIRHAGQRSATQCKSSREAVSQHIKAHPSRDDLTDGMATWGPIAPRHHRDYVDGEDAPPPLGLKIRGPLGTTERVSSVGHAVVVNGGDGKSCTGDSWPKDASIMRHGWSVAVAPMARQSG